uniref:OCIA domain-containing protein 1 n=1 Tax=Pelodiscus sinensis TaxID=13735 RepID=K7GD62_PELSI
MDPPGQVKNPVAYVPTEDERRIFRECNEESFWYRCAALPISAVSMIVTQGLIHKGTGILTTHSRFGSLPKVACKVAGICGYIAGKISYLSICQEKFKKLENSPIGESIRQRHRSLPHEYRYADKKSEFANLPPQSSFGSQTPAAPLSSSYSHEYSSTNQSLSNYEPIPFSSSLNESSPTGITEHNAAGKEPVPLLQESPKRKSVSYEELRNRNRETYEVALTQKGETPAKSSQERPFKKEGIVKVNKYGDTWEE